MKQNVIKEPFFYYFKKYKKLCTRGIVILYITNFSEAFIPLMIGMILDEFMKGDNFIPYTLILMGLYITLALSRYGWRFYWGTFNQTASYHLKSVVFKSILKMKPSQFENHQLGNLFNVTSNDIEAFRLAIGTGTLIFIDSINLIIFSFIMSLYLSWELALKSLIFTPFIPLIVWKIILEMQKRHKKRQQKISLTTSFSQQVISGIKTIKSYCQEKSQNIIFKRYSLDVREASNYFSKINASFFPIINASVCLGSFILLYFGGQEVINGTLTVGMFFAFFTYFIKISWPLTGLSYSLSLISQGRASFQRIRNVLENPEPKHTPSFKSSFSFEKLTVKNLNFHYPNSKKLILKNVNFEIKKGEKVHLIGKTSSGKTTLMNLIRGHYLAPKNSIFINDIPIEDFSKDQLNTVFTTLFQKSFVFQDTIENNVTFFKKDNPSYIKCLKEAEIENEVMGKKEQSGFLISEDGINLSQGQIQRINLARALFNSCDFFIFDNALSSLDIITTNRILNNLTSPHYNQHTFLFITNDVFIHDTISRILILDQGTLTHEGTHEELRRHCPLYYNLCQAQTIESFVK